MLRVCTTGNTRTTNHSPVTVIHATDKQTRLHLESVPLKERTTFSRRRHRQGDHHHKRALALSRLPHRDLPTECPLHTT